MVNAGICGATGYTGLELIRIFMKHPEVKLKAMTAVMDKPMKISEVFGELTGVFEMECDNELSVDKLSKQGIDVVFLALPHTVSMDYAPKFLEKGITVIDLSADFRIKDVAVYEKFYAHKHTAAKYINEAVYGLPELYKAKIKKSKLIANPGCYPTSVTLALAPLLSNSLVEKDVIVDSKSGATGAGRKALLSLTFGEVDENLYAYKVGVHQHMPEIAQELSAVAKDKVNVLFTPHLIPMRRGILSTAYLKLKNPGELSDLVKLYKEFYKNEPFVRVYDVNSLPQIRNVVMTNYCDIGLALSPDKKTAIVISAIDNLLKGASGQAVQNMNIIYGFDEKAGLL